MTAPTWTRRRFLATTAAGTAATAFLAACGSEQTPTSAAKESSKWGGDLVDPGLAKPDVTLTTTDGKPFPFRKATKGKLTLLELPGFRGHGVMTDQAARPAA